MRPTRTMLSHLSQSLSVSLSVCLSLSLCHTPTHTLSVSSLRQSCYRRYRRIITVRPTRTMLSHLSQSLSVSLSVCLSLSLCHAPTHTLSVSSLRQPCYRRYRRIITVRPTRTMLSHLSQSLSVSLSVCLSLSLCHTPTHTLSVSSLRQSCYRRYRRIITVRPTRTMLSHLSQSLSVSLSVSFSLSHTHTHSVCLFSPPALLQEKREDNYSEAHAYNNVSSLSVSVCLTLSVCLFLSVTHPHTLCLSLPSASLATGETGG